MEASFWLTDMGLKQQVKRTLMQVAPYIGAEWVCRETTRSLPRICMYHRFSRQPEYRKLDLAAFEQHLDEIAKHFKVVSMREVARQLREQGAVEPGLATITVDDGYADFYNIAAPALARRGMPATLFVTTKFVEGESWLWPDRLDYGLSRTREPVLRCSKGSWDLSTQGHKAAAWQALIDICVRSPTPEKHELVSEVTKALRVELPSRPPLEYAPASVDQLRELCAAGFEMGAHTCTHPILSQLPATDLESEILGSKLRLEALLDREIVSFCYPNGMPEDINDAAKGVVRSAGFSSAVAAYFRADVLSDPFEIKRYGPGDDLTEVKAFLNGFEHLLDLRKGAKTRVS